MFRIYFNENLNFIEELNKIYDSSIPKFFIGHSMGGLVGLKLGR